jgi:hypothetical protein
MGTSSQARPWSSPERRAASAPRPHACCTRRAKLVLPDLDEQPLVAPADELGSADVLSVACDVRDLAAMEDAVAQAWTGSAGSTRDGQRQDRELRLGAAGRSRDVKTGARHERPGRLPHRARSLARPDREQRLRAGRVVNGRLRVDAGLPAYNASKAGVEHCANTPGLGEARGRRRRCRAPVVDRHPAGAGREAGPQRLRQDAGCALPSPLNRPRPPMSVPRPS